MNTQCTAIVLERGGRWKAEKNEGFFPRSYSIYHPQRRIPNVGPGMKRVPGIPGFSFSKLYRPIRFSCYTLIGQKHEKARASAFFVKFVMVQSAWQVGNIVSFFFFSDTFADSSSLTDYQRKKFVHEFWNTFSFYMLVRLR